jgi:hypothetical protein
MYCAIPRAEEEVRVEELVRDLEERERHYSATIPVDQWRTHSTERDSVCVLSEVESVGVVH